MNFSPEPQPESDANGMPLWAMSWHRDGWRPFRDTKDAVVKRGLVIEAIGAVLFEVRCSKYSWYKGYSATAMKDWAEEMIREGVSYVGCS
jgi:hypothetical protein